ncbi:MAG: thiamine phosphate synthase [Lachnospiraceae bacterium]|nr:thiamine phosphate synthase [Lachnospiraceae bacterium]
MTTNNIKKLVCGNFLKLYAITDYELSDTELLEKTEAALKAGVTCVQLREKNLSKEELIKKAIKLKALCDRYNAVFIVNDYFEVALEVHADGVHVGLDDADVALIRERAGADFIIGATAKTVEVAREAEKKGADYLGVGAMFHSSTKGEARVITKDEFKNIANSVNIPLVAIGGITAENVSEISNMGQAGIAVVGAVYGTDDTEAAVKNLLEKS